MHFTDYDTRVGAYAVIVDDQRRLLLTWFNGAGGAAPRWSLPGGGVEFDESVEQGVVREVYEEAGYHVALGEILGLDHFTVPRLGRTGRPYKSLRVLFTATITGGTLGTTEQGGSTDFARWVPLDDVPDLEPRGDIIDAALIALARTGRYFD